MIVFPICQAIVTPLRQASDYYMKEQIPQREMIAFVLKAMLSETP